ncbi:MAG: hypothetical protein JJ861_17680 [Rhizobiales bacterium]|nr:hypothetical protein [Hyphomicrobiales bacterium]MBO6913901.1 hypothetical protein [Hyphomicrobiales bacterium]MBO6955604.1 hypothetical protein [Hyphomicrobiales bacterium]
MPKDAVAKASGTVVIKASGPITMALLIRAVVVAVAPHNAPKVANPAMSSTVSGK